MKRIVVLPKEIDERLDKLTSLNEEVIGILLYRSAGEYCPVEQSFMLGIGSSGEVEPQEDRLKVSNEFLRRNHKYNFIRFHTHSRGTIRRYGDYYAQNFSVQDREEIKRAIINNPDHIEMLVTPETKMLSGIDNPSLEVVEDFPDYRDRSQGVSKALEVIAKNMGCDLNGLSASR